MSIHINFKKTYSILGFFKLSSYYKCHLQITKSCHKTPKANKKELIIFFFNKTKILYNSKKKSKLKLENKKIRFSKGGWRKANPKPKRISSNNFNFTTQNTTFVIIVLTTSF